MLEYSITVKRVREYGSPGLSQLWKDFGNFKQSFPIYQKGGKKGEIFKSLGSLKLHKKISS
jgi:hypothetical protein